MKTNQFKNLKISNICTVPGTDLISLVIQGVTHYRISIGQTIKCGDKQTIVTHVPMLAGDNPTEMRAIVCIKEDIFKEEDIVDII